MTSRKLLSGLFGSALVLSAGACTESPSGAEDPQGESVFQAASAPDPPELDEVSISLAPTALGPGDLVSLSFPETSQRGGFFQLQAWTGSTWADAIYLLESDAGESGQPSWVVIGEGAGTDDYGVGGPGPDRIQLPESIDPGYWLLCTANSQVERCAQLLVNE